MRRTLIASASLSTLMACSAMALAPAGFAEGETRTYPVGDFTGLEVSGGLEAVFTQADTVSVEVESPDGGFDRIEVTVEDDTLILRRPKGQWRVGRQPRYLVRVSAPVLDEVEVSSGSNLSAPVISGDAFELDISSGGAAGIGTLQAGEVEIEISSGATAAIDAGGCTEIEIEASSGAELDAAGLTCVQGVIDASSGASVAIALTGEVEAEASSGASVRVTGNPARRDVEKSSGGSVSVSP